jgi:3-keto-disaccharide hydrolase
MRTRPTAAPAAPAGRPRLARLAGLAALGGLAGLAVAGCASAQAPPAGHGWRVAYAGYGAVLLGRRTVTLRPAGPSGPASTHAALALSRRSWRDLAIDVRVRTVRQLRRPDPNPWEVGWLLWHYTSGTRFYYVALKPTGWEVGKEDPGFPGDQRFLATGTHPRFPPGRWYQVRVRQAGPVITIWVDGVRLIRLTDTRQPYLSGRVGLYAEDASAMFQPVSIRSK